MVNSARALTGNILPEKFGIWLMNLSRSKVLLVFRPISLHVEKWITGHLGVQGDFDPPLPGWLIIARM